MVTAERIDAARLPHESNLHIPAQQQYGRKRKGNANLSTNPATKRTQDWKHLLSGIAEVLAKGVNYDRAARTKARAWAQKSPSYLNAKKDRERKSIVQAAVDAKVAEWLV
jgi:hypothetical protein